MTGIYKIENLINGKKYIGQSTNIEKRWNKEKTGAFNKNDSAYDYPLSRAFRKYGIENFSFEVIEECPRDSLNEKEQYWVVYYDSFFNGYNQTLGGDSAVGQLNSKEKIIGIIKDLQTTDMIHRDIANKWDISIEMVQGINTGRYWHMDNVTYPLQERCRILNEKKGQGRTKRFCPQCGAIISQKATLCVDCYNKKRRKVERPSREELKALIREQPFVQIAKYYGVSDNAVRKWCDAYELPRKKTEINKISDREWSKI